MNARFVSLISVLAVAALLLGACGRTITIEPTPTRTPEPAGPVAGTPVGYNGPGGNGHEQAPVTGLPDIASVVERTAPAVVLVIATVETRGQFGQVIERTSQGSGVIFDEHGYILTNDHVVADARRVRVTLADRTRHDAEVVGRDPESDLAVLRLDPNRVANLVTAPLGNTEAMRIGDWVIAIGNPLGLEGTVTVGVVSAKHRQLRIDAATTLYDLVQTDANINPGNSGGPLLNLKGEVIGINTAIIRGTLSSGQSAEGIGFAVSMSTAIPVAAQLIENGVVERARLGVFIDPQEVTPALAEERELAVDHGVLIARVIEGSGAHAARMRQGDIIVGLDGRTINTFTDLRRILLADYRPGDQVQVAVVRGNLHLTFDVTLGS